MSEPSLDRISYSLNFKKSLPDYGSVSAQVSFSSDLLPDETREQALDRISTFVEQSVMTKLSDFDAILAKKQGENEYQAELEQLSQHMITVGQFKDSMIGDVDWPELEVFVESMRDRAKKSGKPVPNDWLRDLQMISKYVKIKREIEDKCRSTK